MRSRWSITKGPAAPSRNCAGACRTPRAGYRFPVTSNSATSLAAGLLTLLTCAAATAAAPAPERTLLAEPPRAIADFQLTDQAGKTVKLADLRGAPVLMFFGFTHCADVCPAALHQLRQLEREHRTELGKTRIVI